MALFIPKGNKSNSKSEIFWKRGGLKSKNKIKHKMEIVAIYYISWKSHCNKQLDVEIQWTNQIVLLSFPQDQYGNYVIQHILEHGRPEDKSKIVAELRGKILALLTHPYGCLVIQRILEHCTLDQTLPILEEIHAQTERLVQVCG